MWLRVCHVFNYGSSNGDKGLLLARSRVKGDTMGHQNAGNELDGQEMTGSDHGEEVDGGGSRDVSKRKRWMDTEEVDVDGGDQDKEVNGTGSGMVKRWMAAEGSMAKK
ncbi:hypothetical protein FQA39_LY15613 [Lamprigera yunnana]|nr:hypothetical protein FQA39_LY15613 [Lamprigera yunnana]